jgi:hypothetical protein
MTEKTPPSQTGPILARIGAWLQVTLVVGLVRTVIAMKSAFAELGKSGDSGPGALSEAIGDVLKYSLIGMSLSFVGLILLSIALFLSQIPPRLGLVLFRHRSPQCVWPALPPSGHPDLKAVLGRTRGQFPIFSFQFPFFNPPIAPAFPQTHS